MQAVWMARMEKQGDGEEQYQGLLSAGEDEGKWLVIWEPEDVPGDYERPSSLDVLVQAQTWYEGESWQEMRAALRSGMAQLLREGFQPVLGFMPDTNLHERRMKERNEWICCYGDLHVNDQLYEKLAQWRREMAISTRRAPYWIATNRMLRLVSAFVPHTAEELKQIPGFGEAKVASYADAIVAITQLFERQHCFPLDWVVSTIPESEFIRWVYEQEQAKMESELGKLTQRRLLLEGVRNGLSAPELMERLQIDRRELIMRIETLSSEGYDMQPFVELELSDTSKEEEQAIRSALLELGTEYLKPVFLRIYGEEGLNGSSAEMQRRYERIRLLRMMLSEGEQQPSTQQSA